MQTSEPRGFVKFTFFKVADEWRRLPALERQDARVEFAAAVREISENVLSRSYSLVGLRGDADFLLWQIGASLDALQAAAISLGRTRLGAYLSQPYSYLAMTRRSEYVGREHQEQAEARLTVSPSGARYLFVYPFVKTRAWYRMTKAARQGMMNEHIAVGRKYPSVKLNTTYSFGLDDQEFVLAFETDRPEDFLDLVMELRETEVSLFTLRDTPIFSCIAMDIGEIVETLGG